MAKAMDLIGQKFGKLTVIKRAEKKHSHGVLWECQCECGNLHYAITNELNRGRVRSCGCLKIEKGREKVKDDIIGKQFGLLTVIKRVPDPNNPNRTKWLCLCECGNTHLAERNHLIDGHINSCGCLKRKSLGELKIQSLLEKNNIPFIKEKTFEDCRSPITNYPLRFDFYVNNKYLIEFDGKQHFYSSTGNYDNPEKFNKTQIHDEYKNSWCKEHNIPLIRISYKQYDSLTIDDLIPSENK